MRAQSLSHVQLFVTAWTVTHQSPLSVGFPRQEYWSGFLLTQGPKLHLLCLLRCQRILYLLSHQGSPFLIGSYHQQEQ